MKEAGKIICFFNSNKVWGGGEKWHYEFSRNLAKEGYRVFTVTNYHSDLFKKLKLSGFPVLQVKIGNLSFLNPFKVLKLAGFYKKNQIETVILGLSCDLKIGGIAAKLAGVNKIFYRRGSAIPVKDSFLNRYLFRYILTGVIVNSLEIKRLILKNNSKLIDPDRIHLLYNCVDSQTFSAEPNPNDFMRKVDGEIWLGNVGRMVEQKGQNYLVDMAGLLKKRQIRFKLFIAGKGKLENQLKKQINSLDLKEEVVLTGFLPDICSFLKSIDIFLLPSIHEGSANVLLEAMACKKPVVAFNVSSMSEIVDHERTGYLAEFKNIESFTGYVSDLIHDNELRLKMGANGQQRIKEKFNADFAGKELIRIIEA